jgi:hypothetical protein
VEEERGTSDALGGAHSAPFVDKPTGRPTAHYLGHSMGPGNASVPGRDGHELGRAVGEGFGRKRGNIAAGGGEVRSILLAAAAQDTGRVAERPESMVQSVRWPARIAGGEWLG